MGNPQDSDRGVAAVVESASPGQRLRLAREARKLTRDAIAAQMRIEPKVIDALERDDYSQLPATVFVRGYLRAYAKLVGLSAEPLVDTFDQHTAKTPPPLVLPTAVGPDMAARSGYARWIVFALALLSLLLFYQWWHLEGGKPQVAVAPPTALPQPVVPTVVPAPAPAQNTQTVVETPAAVPTPEPGTPLENMYDTPADESGLGEVTAAPSTETSTVPPSVAAKPAAPAVSNKPADSSSAAAPAPTQASAPAEVQPPVTSATATGQLVLRFHDDCWVVIRDASGRALLHGLIKSGDWHVLSGKPPFELTLGNSPGVEIEYLGKRFDQSRYTGTSKIAHFTLGK